MGRKIRTKVEALKEAKRIWGKYAFVWILGSWPYARIVEPGLPRLSGEGATWTEALADAKRRNK